MKIINLNDAIENHIAFLNRDAGGEADFVITQFMENEVRVHIRAWVTGAENGMMEWDEDMDADRLAEELHGVDADGGAEFVDDGNGGYDLAVFDTVDERDAWKAQV